PGPRQPVESDDQDTRLGQMGRGALAVTVTSDAGIPVRLITTHLKSKLLTFPGGRFNPRDEDESARYAAYALPGASPRPPPSESPLPRLRAGTAINARWC